jgi:phosphatidylglycerol:prolipoprotein diacylglycerol transferase
MIGPAMLVGLGLGRLGCLMNGCCYGGVCETGPFSIVFPEFTSPRQQVTSPPYLDQLLHGQLHGIRLVEEPRGRVVVQRVERGSSAERVGVKPGLEVQELNDRPVTGMGEVRQVFAQRPLLISLRTADGESFAWSLDRMPTHSRPVHPTQIYSAINAFLLAWMLWQLYPYRTRDGQIIAATIGLYAITRFLLEIIRTDEAARFGTPLTISQLVSLIALAVIAGLFFYIQWQPRRVRNLER